VALVFLVILVGRLFALQVVSSERSRELARRNWLRPEYVPGPRGRILDRNGLILAEMVPSFAVAIDAHLELFQDDPGRLDSTLVDLALLIGGDVEGYRTTLEKQKRFSYKPVRLERGVDSVTVARVAEHRFRLPGVTVEVEPIRRYPQGSLAGHVLGYVGEVGEEELETRAEEGYRPGSLLGKTGIELEYEDQLRGEDGVRYVEVNALGRRSEAFNRELPIPPRPGRDVVLSLDAGIQRTAEEALAEAGYDGEGDPPEVRGAAVLLDVRSGEVLALASLPGFDVNLFSRSISQEEWDHLTRASRPLLNRALQASYPPGSVFKPLTQYAALAEGLITPDAFRGPCYGGHRFGNRVFHCWKRSGHGSVDARKAMAQSCDVYFYEIAPGLGVDGIARYGRLFRVTERTGIDLPQEAEGLIADPEYYDERFGKRGWSPGVALNLVIGQGEIQLTPLELVQFAGVLATGGRRVLPHLLRALGTEERVQRYREPDLAHRSETIPLDAGALTVVREGMRRAVERGTAVNASLPGIPVVGKTGTSQNPGFDHALFIAYAPAVDPEVAVAVVLENRGHGGSVAAPIARRILASYFGIPDSLAVARLETD
jgi:penicillin-binding protein 2